MKGNIRILGVDDGYFEPRKKGKTALIGVIFRLDGRIEGLLKKEVSVDGFDSTAKIIRMCNKSKFSSQIHCVLLCGINVAGFNVIDIQKVFKKTGKPVIVVFRKMPRMQLIENALSKLKNGKKRLKLIKKAGQINSFKSIFFQCVGIEAQDAKLLLKKTIFYSNLPEPVRIAHLVASAVTLGESTPP